MLYITVRWASLVDNKPLRACRCARLHSNIIHAFGEVIYRKVSELLALRHRFLHNNATQYVYYLNG